MTILGFTRRSNRDLLLHRRANSTLPTRLASSGCYNATNRRGRSGGQTRCQLSNVIYEHSDSASAKWSALHSGRVVPDRRRRTAAAPALTLESDVTAAVPAGVPPRRGRGKPPKTRVADPAPTSNCRSHSTAWGDIEWLGEIIKCVPYRTKGGSKVLRLSSAECSREIAAWIMAELVDHRVFAGGRLPSLSRAAVGSRCRRTDHRGLSRTRLYPCPSNSCVTATATIWVLLFRPILRRHISGPARAFRRRGIIGKPAY